MLFDKTHCFSKESILCYTISGAVFYIVKRGDIDVWVHLDGENHSRHPTYPITDSN